MAVIGYFIGICFFAALAASGFVITVQILYWLGVATMFFVAIGNYINAKRAIYKLSQNKPLPKEIETVIPIISGVNFDLKCVHIFFSNVIHAVIAYQIVHAPILAVFIVLAAVVSMLSMQKFKEMMKYVNNDSRYKQ